MRYGTLSVCRQAAPSWFPQLLTSHTHTHTSLPTYPTKVHASSFTPYLIPQHIRFHRGITIPPPALASSFLNRAISFAAPLSTFSCDLSLNDQTLVSPALILGLVGLDRGFETRLFVDLFLSCIRLVGRTFALASSASRKAPSLLIPLLLLTIDTTLVRNIVVQATSPRIRRKPIISRILSHQHST